jgi:hypothetical protein
MPGQYLKLITANYLHALYNLERLRVKKEQSAEKETWA